MLTSQEIIKKGIITEINHPKQIQQVGIDLEIEAIYLMQGTGTVGAGGTTLPQLEPLNVDRDNCWNLSPGVYDIQFKQGCKIPKDATVLLRQRSSLARMGGQIHSSVFDPGFETAAMGTILYVHRRLRIEKGARVCQAYAHQHENVDNMYDGQFQGDKQRKKQ